MSKAGQKLIKAAKSGIARTWIATSHGLVRVEGLYDRSAIDEEGCAPVFAGLIFSSPGGTGG